MASFLYGVSPAVQPASQDLLRRQDDERQWLNRRQTDERSELNRVQTDERDKVNRIQNDQRTSLNRQQNDERDVLNRRNAPPNDLRIVDDRHQAQWRTIDDNHQKQWREIDDRHQKQWREVDDRHQKEWRIMNDAHQRGQLAQSLIETAPPPSSAGEPAAAGARSASPVNSESINLLGQQLQKAGRYREAYSAYQLAAEQGNLDAVNNLGFMHHEGLGVARDFAAASRYYLDAGKRGHVGALINLGLLFASGTDFQKNVTMAYALFSLAAVRAREGHVDREDATRLRRELSATLSADELFRGQQLTQELERGQWPALQ